MKKIILLFFIISLICTSLMAQTTALEKNRTFSGAKASLKSYHAIYQLDSNDPTIISKAIRNINNAFANPRLKSKLTIELIAFSCS